VLTAGRPARSSPPRPGASQLRRRGEDLVDVALDLDFTPLAPKHAFGVDQKRAALDAERLAPVHILLFDDVELLAERFVRVGDELERQRVLCLEFLVRGEAVARHSEDANLAPLEL